MELETEGRAEEGDQTCHRWSARLVRSARNWDKTLHGPVRSFAAALERASRIWEMRVAERKASPNSTVARTHSLGFSTKRNGHQEAEQVGPWSPFIFIFLLCISLLFLLLSFIYFLFFKFEDKPQGHGLARPGVITRRDLYIKILKLWGKN